MKIESINGAYNTVFKSLRTDKNNIATLKNGSMPILENKKENILSALANMANNPERGNIEFLLDVAQNLHYGQGGNSEFKDVIDETTDISSKRENTDWSQLLSDTIQQALSDSDEDTDDLEVAYQKLFNTKKPLTEEQRQVLELRTQVKNGIINQESLEDADALDLTAQVSKNIDYFVSSSEISFDQKKECLEKFIYFLSDDYPITPQLADKKVQIMDEMLNDMLIKVPGQEILTTKGVNQLYSGICAAISLCRKAIAYEDKSRYVDLVLEELKDSPVMEVYDVTDLNSGKKVNIPKINIDYNSAILQGYRILDASAHHWMQNAHSSGDGTIQSENYVAFDDDTYGIYNDSSWYEGFNPNLASEKVLLQNVIREKELLDSVLKQKRKTKDASHEISEAKKYRTELQSKINGELNRIFASIFPEMSDGDITRLIRSVLKFYGGVQSNNEVNISRKMPRELRQSLISDFIKKQTNTPADNKEINGAVDNNSAKVLDYIEQYIDADNSIKKLAAFNSNKSQYAYYRKLFQLAAAHSIAIENDVNLNTGIVRYEKISGLPVRTKQITSYLKKLQQSFEKPEVLKYFAEGQSKEQTEKELLYDILRIESLFPKQIDDISKTLFGVSSKEQTRQLLVETRDRIKLGNKELSDVISSISGIKNDKTQIVNYLDKWIKKFEGNISDEEIEEAIRILGFEDRINMFKSVFSQFLINLRSGISPDEMEMLAERFGGEDKVVPEIQAQQNKFVELLDKYNAILSRWQVPSSRELIINKMEKDQKVLSKAKLDVLKKKFDYVRFMQSRNESIENIKERKKANEHLYEFTNDELDILRLIEKTLPYMKKYCKTTYNELNKELFDELEKQYANIGMLNGQFWVREEGSSGLSSNEQVRIIEQMTGKPYHVEKDIEKAVQYIKKGDGSGVINYSVDDGSYAFHAQYVPSVTSEPTGNSEEQLTEDVLWTDNSWGKAEKDSFWKGRNGLKYTDYGSDYGWKNGFILNDDLRIGQNVSAVKFGTGFEPKDKDEFALFLDMILPGTPVDAYQKLYKMFSYIFAMDQGIEHYSALENTLKQGVRINTKSLEALDSLVEQKTEVLRKKAEQIKTKENYEKLPKDDFLKFILESLSVYMATDSPDLADNVLMATSVDDLDKVKKYMLEELVQEMGSIICKSDDTIEKLMLACNSDITSVFDELEKNYNIDFDKQKRSDILNKVFMLSDGNKLEKSDGSLNSFEAAILKQTETVAAENISDENARKFFIEQVQGIIKREVDGYLRIKSLDSPILANSPMHDEFIAAVDKYLSPTSDKDLLDLIIGLQNAGYEQSDAFLGLLKAEDVGLNFKDPFEYIHFLKTGDSSVNKAFSELIATNVINSEMNHSKNTALPEATESDDENSDMYMSAEDLYRALYIKLSDMDVQKYIRDFKAEAFLKYKVRQAFPQPFIIKEEDMEKVCSEMYDYIDNLLQDVRKNDFITEVFDRYTELTDAVKSSGLNKIINNQGLYTAGSLLNNDIDKILNILNSYSEFLCEDESLDMIKQPVDKLISLLSQNPSSIDIKSVKAAYNEIQHVFNSWESSNVRKEGFVQKTREDIAQIKNDVSLLVNANISPRYKNEAFERINKIIGLMKKGDHDSELQYEKSEFIDFFIKRHIVNDPTKLLNECVQMIQNGQDGTQEYTVLKNYLLKALKIAQQTKAQYKMVQNAHEGISSKTKELLPLFNVYLKDGSQEGMDSEVGMIYLINQLENESDDHTALKLFLAQSGLSKLSLNALINNFDGEASSKIVDETYDGIMQGIDAFEKINEIFDKFVQLEKSPSKSIEEAIKQLRDFVSGKFKNDKDNSVIEKYLEYMDSVQINPELRNVAPEMIMPLVISLSKDAIAYAGEDINAQIDSLVGVSKILEDRYSLIELIEVPEDSDENKRRLEFRDKYNNMQQDIQDKLHKIQERIENSAFMSAEYA